MTDHMQTARMARLSTLAVIAFCVLITPVRAGSTEPAAGRAKLVAFHNREPRVARNFASDAEAQRVLSRLLGAAGLASMEDRFRLAATPDVANAMASIDEAGQRLILYNPEFMRVLAAGIGSDWPKVFVLAHEVSHHIRFHTVINGRDHEFELEADYQAGFILRRLGAPLDEVQKILLRIGPEHATATHPGRAARINASTSGWQDANSRSSAIPIPGPSQRGPSVQNNIGTVGTFNQRIDGGRRD